jgi:hypothetical protein
MGMHQHTAGRSQSAGTQGTVGPQRHVRAGDMDPGQTADGGEGQGRRSRR